MQDEIFRSDRYFILFDVIASHGQLLIRSQKSDLHKKNIDIVFFGTTYIQLFARLETILIRKLQDPSRCPFYETVHRFLKYENNHIFEIISNDESYYVAASFVKVFQNELDFDESSLNSNKGREFELATSEQRWTLCSTSVLSFVAGAEVLLFHIFFY